MSDRPRKQLVISEDDLASSPDASPAPAPTQALPTVEGAPPQARRVDVGAPPLARSSGSGNFLRTVQGRNIAAAACGITLGWAVCEITHLGLWTATSSFGQDLTVGVYTGVVGLCFAVVYAGWEQILARSGEGIKLAVLRAGPWGFGLAFAAGFVAQIVYRHFVYQILRGITLAEVVNISSNVKLYLARAMAWGLFGLGMGVAVAGGLKAKEKLINGVIGGAVGGAVGGIVFHWASFNIHSETAARFVGLIVVGVSIGLAIGLVEKARRDAWMHITHGPMAGKEFIVYGALCNIGSSPKCDITLIKDPTIAPYHAVIRTLESSGTQSRVLDAYEGCAVTVNGILTSHQQLRSGDIIGFGSMAVAYSERVTV
jgi:hypothetical protein